MQVWLPYGSTEIVLPIPDENLAEIPGPTAQKSPAMDNSSIMTYVKEALGSEGLLRAGTTVAVAVQPDATGHIEIVLDALIQILYDEGVPTDGLTVFTPAASAKARQLRAKIEAFNAAGTEFSPVGGDFPEFKVPSNFLKAKVKIVLSEVGLDCCAGYSGPHKAAEWLGSPSWNRVLGEARFSEDVGPGRLDGNPFFETLQRACNGLGLDLAVNLVVGDGGYASVHAGPVNNSFSEAVSGLNERLVKKTMPRVDILVVSLGGLPWDRDLRTSLKWISNVVSPIRAEGSMVLAAECAEGIGSRSLVELFSEFKERKLLAQEIRRRNPPDAHLGLHLLQALEQFKVYTVSALPDRYSNLFGLRPVKTGTHGIQLALKTRGKDSKIAVVEKASNHLLEKLSP